MNLSKLLGLPDLYVETEFVSVSSRDGRVELDVGCSISLVSVIG